jgi:hypothetical protein
MDIEFVGMSYDLAKPRPPPLSEAFFHELDLVVVEAGARDRPSHDQIVIGVGCKNTDKFQKRMAREAFGVRRELSLRISGLPRLQTWPIQNLPAVPASCLLVYASDGRVVRYVDPGRAYGVQFAHFMAPETEGIRGAMSRPGGTRRSDRGTDCTSLRRDRKGMKVRRGPDKFSVIRGPACFCRHA